MIKDGSFYKVFKDNIRRSVPSDPAVVKDRLEKLYDWGVGLRDANNPKAELHSIKTRGAIEEQKGKAMNYVEHPEVPRYIDLGKDFRGLTVRAVPASALSCIFIPS